jgi:hypothetical protein
MADVVIRVISKNATGGALQEVSEDLRGIGGAAVKSGGAISGFFSNMLSTAGGFLAANVIGNIAGQFGGLAQSMVSGNAEFERYGVQFGVLLGSADAAKGRLADLARFGATTPFELPEVVRADKILQSFGLHAVDSAKKFGMSGEQIRTMAGDLAAGTGSSFEEISGYLGKFASGATGEAIARFQELGIVTRQELAGMGVKFSKSGELVTPVNEAMTTMLQVMKGKFGGMMEAQSATFEGMMSNLMDWKGGVLRALGEPIFEALKTRLSAALAFLNSEEMQANVAAFANLMAAGVGRVASFVDSTVMPVFKSLYEVTQLLRTGDFRGGIFGLQEDSFPIDMLFQFRDGVASIFDAMQRASDVFSAGGGGLVGIVAALGISPETGAMIVQFGVTLMDTFRGAQEVLGAAFERIGGAVAYVLEAFRVFGPGALSEIVAFVTGGQSSFDNLTAIFTNVRVAAVGLFESLVGFVQQQLPVWEAYLHVWGARAWEWIRDVLPVVIGQLDEWRMQLIDALVRSLPGWVATLATWGRAAWQWIVDAWPVVQAQLMVFAGNIFAVMVERAASWREVLHGWGTAAWTWIQEAAPVTLAALGLWAGQLFTWLADNLPGWIRQLAEWATAATVWIAESLPGWIEKAGEFLAGVIAWGNDEATPAMEEIAGGWARALWEWVERDLIPEIGPALLKLDSAIRAALGEIQVAMGKAALNIGGAIVDGLISGITGKQSTLGQEGAAAIGGLVEQMRVAGQIQSPSRLFAEAVGVPIGQGVLVGVRRELTGFDFGAMLQAVPSRPAVAAALSPVSGGRVARLAGEGWGGSSGGSASTTTNNSKQTVVNITVPNVSSAQELADVTRFNARFWGS